MHVHNPFNALLEAAEETRREDETTGDAMTTPNLSGRISQMDVGDTGDGQGLATPLPNG